MKLLDNQLNCIYELISCGVACRNVILDKITENDLELRKVSELYKETKDELEIAKELNISIKEAREKIAEIDFINKTIDSILSKKYMKESERNRSEANKEEKICARTKRNLYIKQIKEFLSKYIKARDEGSIEKMNLEKNADIFATKIDYIGERVSYRLFLAEMYSYIGQLQKARGILSWYDKVDLTDMERRQYENVEKGIVIEENKRLIKRLCERGKNYEEILDECERVGTGNRVMMNTKFVRQVMSEYQQEKIKQDQEHKNKQELDKSEQLLEEQKEIELER